MSGFIMQGDLYLILLCTWHVDRAWHGKRTLIKGKQIQMVVYHSLCLLMEETEVQKFEMLLTKTVQQLKTNATTTEFGQYFVNTYMRRKEQWACCNRQQPLLMQIYTWKHSTMC